ncbi:MAG: hypothetical protein CHACPFDD_01397 [Phycisphaerae bacterium]|nr:hypothetical protein [Phycisphaerae bacterium]
MHRILAPALLLVGLVAADIARAQPATDPLAELRTHPTISDDDRKVLQQWIETRVAAVQPSDAAGASQAVQALRDAVQGATPAFREAYVALTIKAVGAAYRKAELREATRLIALVNALAEPVAVELLAEALKDERIGVRCAAAVGLTNLRAKIAITGGKVFTESMEALRQAGKGETSGLVLSYILHAINYPEVVPNPPEPKLNVDVLLDILDTRLKAFDAGTARIFGADVTALKVASALRSFMTDADRRRTIIAAGKMLRGAVKAYASAEKGPTGVVLPERERRDTELLIREAEKLLAELLALGGGAPSITREMEKVDQTAMKIKYTEWADKLKAAVDLELYLDADAASKPAGGG